MNQKDKLLAIVDVAFSNNVDKKTKVSFNRTIDVQFGIYRWCPDLGEECKALDGYLTISLKPSHGWKDWAINIAAFPDKAGLHMGYHAEWEKYRQEFMDCLEPDWAQKALKKGCIIAGRSKGGAEAVMIAEDIFGMIPNHRERLLVGAIEAPHMCDKDWKEVCEIFIPRQNILVTCYRNDIVPDLVPWLTIPGQRVQLGERKSGLSCKDHRRSTTQEELLYEEIEKL